MKRVKYEVRATLVHVADDPLPFLHTSNFHHTFGSFIALDPEDALRAAIEKARLVETIGQRSEDFHTVNVRIVKITEEDVQ